MALNRSEHYPGRFLATTSEHPQGAFKNRTSPTSNDGTYFHADWATDIAALHEAILTNAGETPNNSIDTATDNQVFNALVKVIGNAQNPVGSVLFFASSNVDPNTLYTGQTWVNLSIANAERMIRLSALGGNGLTTGGSDTVTLTVDNLPEHNHGVGTISVASHSAQTLTTASSGAHTHDIQTNGGTSSSNVNAVEDSSDDNLPSGKALARALSAGAHTHTVSVPEMSHSVSGSTGSTGSGQAIDITNKYVDIFAWQRTA